MDPKTPIKDAGRLYKMYAGRLEKLGIQNLQDLLYHVPFRYEDYSLISSIGSVQVGDKVTLKGKITDIKNSYTRAYRTIQKAVISDETGNIEAIWFNQPFILKTLSTNDI